MGGASIQIAGYELLRQLGVGGMSTVWLAVQQSLERKVAIKVMRRVSDTSPEDARQFEKRFLLEGRTMARLPHRNIVAVYDIVTNDEVSYIAMEYLEGGTLAERMKEGLSLGEAVAVVIQIAGALDYAHSQGIVHRDLKPANIMFRDALTPVLTDFGIARQQDAQATRLTQTGMLVGTPNYMSPEQISGGEIDGRSDLYSLGVMFYELLTGHTPFSGDTPIAVMMAHLTQAPPQLPEEFAHFQPIMERLLAKNREERYASLREFVVAVKQGVMASDTLLTRLQIDPNLTTSEQLRKIGFSLSDPTGKSWRSLGAPDASTPLPRTGEAAAPRTPSGRVPAPAAGPAVSARLPARPPPAAPAREPAAPARPRWPLFAAVGVLAALLIGGGVWWSRRGGNGLSDQQRALIGYQLKDAERLFGEGKLLSPPRDNAFEILQQVQQIDPSNAEAEALLARIVGAQREAGEKALQAGDFAAAKAAVQGGLVVHRDDAELVALQQRIDAAQKAAEVKRQLDQLLAGAEAARKAGRPFGTDGTWAQLRRAQELAPQDAGVRERLAAFVGDQLTPARTALAAKDVARAQAALAELKPELGTEAAFAELAKAAEDAARQAEQEQRLLAALRRAQAQLKAGKLAEPPGDNAVESLAALRALAADDARIGAFAAELAGALVEDGRRNAAAAPQRALERADQALQAAPQFAAATALKNELEQKLNQQQLEIARGLSAARQALGEKRFLAPANANARAAIDAVLKLDPQNAEARQLAIELPRRILDAAKADTDTAAALALARAGAAAYANDGALAELVRQLDARLGKEQAAAAARSARERIATLLAATPASVERLRSAGKELAPLLQADANDADALALRRRLAEAYAPALAASDTPAALDALVAAAKDAQDLLRAEPAYLALPAQASALRAKLVEAEQARLAALQGELVLNAQPWGRVERVQDGDGKAVELPADASTPLVLALPAGSYTVTFSHPQSRRPVSVIARVQARQRSVASAAFPTITAEDYFSRAGW